MNIQEMINKAVKLLTENEDLLKEFDENPVKVLEKILGVDLPDDKVNAIVDGIRAKIKVDDVMETAGKLMGLFGRK